MMLSQSRLAIEEIVGSGPFAVALARMGVRYTDQTLQFRDRLLERIPEGNRIVAVALGQTQILLATPLPPSARMPKRKPAPGPCPLVPTVLGDFVDACAPLLDSLRYTGKLESWVRSRIVLGIESVCRSLEPVIARLSELYASEEISRAMHGACLTTAEIAGMFGRTPPFAAPSLPRFFDAGEPRNLAPLLASPLCANLFNASLQACDAAPRPALPTGQIAAFESSIVPPNPMPTADSLRAYMATVNDVPRWLEIDPFALGFLAIALSDVLMTCGCLWGLQALMGAAIKIGVWGLARIVVDTNPDPMRRFLPPTETDIFRAVHRYYVALTTNQLVTQLR
jgi:hypothetical protein